VLRFQLEQNNAAPSLLISIFENNEAESRDFKYRNQYYLNSFMTSYLLSLTKRPRVESLVTLSLPFKFWNIILCNEMHMYWVCSKRNIDITSYMLFNCHTPVIRVKNRLCYNLIWSLLYSTVFDKKKLLLSSISINIVILLYFHSFFSKINSGKYAIEVKNKEEEK
jgi:hypothetical protein